MITKNTKPRQDLPSTTFFKKSGAGFTLIESMVTIFIFAILMTIVGAVFATSLNMQRRAFNTQQAEENASFVLEAMAKEIRVSKINGPNSNCPSSPAATLSMVHPVNGNIIYTLAGNAVHRVVNGQDSVMSSNTVLFTRLQFCVSGTTVSANQQPRVTILASIRSASALQQATIDIQTTLSQRLLSQ